MCTEGIDFNIVQITYSDGFNVIIKVFGSVSYTKGSRFRYAQLGTNRWVRTGFSHALKRPVIDGINEARLKVARTIWLKYIAKAQEFKSMIQ